MPPILILLPIIAALIGWLTNYLAVKMLFHPKLPLQVLGFSIQGVFPKRQKQLADKLGSLVAASGIERAKQQGWQRLRRPRRALNSDPSLPPRVAGGLQAGPNRNFQWWSERYPWRMLLRALVRRWGALMSASPNSIDVAENPSANGPSAQWAAAQGPLNKVATE